MTKKREKCNQKDPGTMERSSIVAGQRSVHKELTELNRDLCYWRQWSEFSPQTHLCFLLKVSQTTNFHFTLMCAKHNTVPWRLSSTWQRESQERRKVIHLWKVKQIFTVILTMGDGLRIIQVTGLTCNWCAGLVVPCHYLLATCLHSNLFTW